MLSPAKKGGHESNKQIARLDAIPVPVWAQPAGRDYSEGCIYKCSGTLLLSMARKRKNSKGAEAAADQARIEYLESLPDAKVTKQQLLELRELRKKNEGKTGGDEGGN